MSRNTSAAVTSATQLPQVRMRMLCEVWSLNGGTAYACTGDKFIYSGTTYSPVGRLGGLEKIQEESDPFPRSVRVWFAAINSAVIADVLSETLFSKPAKLYRCLLDDNYAVIGAPQLAFIGYVNQVDMKLADPERGNYFELDIESRLRQPTKARYFNRETLQNAFGNSMDTFFDYQAQIPMFVAPWGNQAYGISYAGQVSVNKGALPNYSWYRYLYGG